MTEKYEYCITISRTFVHDCSYWADFVIFLLHFLPLQKENLLAFQSLSVKPSSVCRLNQ